MKDFNQILEQKREDPVRNSIRQPQQIPEQKQSLLAQVKNKIIKLSGPILLTVFTGPFNTASMLLQTSQKPKSDAFFRKVEQAGESNKFVRTGIYGDNKIYKSFQFKGYHDCLAQLGKEGLRGFYKGNLTGVIIGLVNAKMRTVLYEESNKFYNFSEEWKSNLLTILTCVVADLFTLPLMFSQTRLVFQNSLANFRTYSGIYDTLRSTSARVWMSGASVLLFKNILFTLSWYSFFKGSAVQSFIFSTILSHIVTYPFMTIIRQLQSNQVGTAMMNQRSENVRECVKRIWRTMGPLGFYRGFIGYAGVHTFLNVIMIEMNVRSGYFSEMSG